MTANLPAKVQEAYDDVRVRLSDPTVKRVLVGTGAVLLFAYGLYRRNLAGVIISSVGAYVGMKALRAWYDHQALITTHGDDRVIEVDAEYN